MNSSSDMGLAFDQVMTGAGVQLKAIELFQFLDSLQTGGIERAHSVESVKNYAFQEVAQSHVVVIGKSPQDFQEPLFHADSGLYSFDGVHTKVPIYHGRLLRQDLLGDGQPLNVGGAFVNPADLGVAI